MKTTIPAPAVCEQIIAYVDLSGYHRRICSQQSPEETYAFLSAYYATAQHALNDSNGRIVKFIGDALLLLFPSTNPKAAITALRKLKTAVDSFLVQGGLDSHVCIKAHVGIVAAGMLGTGALERFDVCGMAVNHAALLPGGEWVLSEELQSRINAQ